MIRIAQVGMEMPMTMADIYRMGEAARRMGTRKWTDDVVNLLYKRDFLAETHMYDGVVLHSIFHTSSVRTLAATIRDAQPEPHHAVVPISPRHSVEAWRARLIATQAQHIVVFETLPVSLSGWQLEQLQGYTLERDGRTTHYRRVHS